MSFVCNGYIIKDLSRGDSSYPKLYVGSGNLCGYIFEFLCSAESGGEDCSTLSFTDANQQPLLPSTHTSQILLSVNGVSSIISVSLNVPVGQHTILINSIYDINIECKKMDFSNVELKHIASYNEGPQTLGYSLGNIYQLIGIEYDFLTLYLSGYVDQGVCTYIAVGQGLFSVICRPSSTFDLSNISVSITSGSDKKEFKLQSIVRDNNYGVVNYKTYPSEEHLNGLELFGYGETAILSITFNTTIDKLYYFIQPNDVIPSYTQWYSISGDENSTTFLYPLTTYSDPSTQEPNYYYLYYISNSNIINYSNTTPTKTTIYNYNKAKFPAPVLINSYFGGLAVITIGFAENKRYDLPSIGIIVRDTGSISSTRYPYGYTSNTNNSYNYGVSCLVKSSSSINPLSVQLYSANDDSGGIVSYTAKDTFVDNGSPSVSKYERIELISDIVLFKFYISTPNGFRAIKLSNGLTFGIESLVSGDEFQGVYEVTLTTFSDFLVTIYDQAGLSFQISSSTVFWVDPQTPERFIGAKYIKSFFTTIQNVSFLYNDLDVTNRTVYNVLYFNYTQSNVPRDTVFRLYVNGPSLLFQPEYGRTEILLSSYTFPSVYNETLQLFQIEFYVNANIEIGDYSFIIIGGQQYLRSQILNTKLRIKKSLLDYQGPLFKQITKIQQNIEVNNSNKYGIIGWIFTIEDQPNGFDYGYITIKGQLDESIYNIALNIGDVQRGGNRYLGQYEVKLNISYPCITQEYIITEVALYDVMGRSSYFSITNINQLLVVSNPFLYYLQDTTINKIQLQCSTTDNTIASKDITPPTLDSFSASTDTTSNQIDVSSQSRIIDFTFTSSDPESGLKDNIYPIVYLSNSNNEIIECKSRIESISSTSAQYSCFVQVPFGFGYPGSIIFSVYGLTNNNGLFSGFTTKDLFDQSYSYYVDTKFITTTDVLLITSNSNITSRGGDLYLFGRGLNNAIQAFIKYDIRSSTSETIQIGNKYSTAIQIPNIKPTFQPFEIYLESSTLVSNKIIIKPILYQYNIHQLQNCNGNGINAPSGECICNNKWTTILYGSHCTVPNHYISTSTQVLPTTGGEITLYGWFGSIHDTPSLYINNKQISIDPLTSITSDSIKAIIEPGELGPVKVSYTQNSIIFNGTIYPYLSTEKECPPKCSINGICDKTSGKCICNSQYTGLDCSSPINNNNNGTETEVGNNGTTIIKNKDLGFIISIDSIIELDYNNNEVSTFNLSNNWIFINKINSITTFNQNRSNEDSTIAPIYLIIEEVNDKDKDFTFAGNQFTVTKGGFKLSISISNWLYKSNLNRLSLILSSDIQTSSNNCNNNNNKAIIESSSSNNYLSNSINYLKIIKNNRIFYSRYQDKMLADNRPTTISAQLLSPSSSSSSSDNTVRISLNLPRCNECLIDPDFSLLISPDYKNECETSSKKWIIAVAVVCGVAVLTAVSVGVFITYKRSTFLKIKVYAFKKYLTSNK